MLYVALRTDLELVRQDLNQLCHFSPVRLALTK